MKKHLLILALVGSLITGCSGRHDTAPRTETVDTIPMLVMQIQKCSRLTTAEYRLHKIVTHEDQMRLKGTFLAQEYDITLPFGDRKIAIPIDATVKASIDFNDFSAKNIRRRGRKLEVILPDPKVELTSSRINHDEIKKQVSILRGSFTDAEMSAYEKQGRAAILNDIPRLGIIPLAQESAANILIPMFTALGYQQEDITITFRKQFTIDDIPALLDAKPLAR